LCYRDRGRGFRASTQKWLLLLTYHHNVYQTKNWTTQPCNLLTGIQKKENDLVLARLRRLLLLLRFLLNPTVPFEPVWIIINKAKRVAS
jgi:hypothetical protein